MLTSYSRRGHGQFPEVAAAFHSLTLDQTSSAVLNLFCQLLFHPEYQGRLQAELDAAGADCRTLRMEEIRILPLWNAIWKESLRFTPAPLGEYSL